MVGIREKEKKFDFDFDGILHTCLHSRSLVKKNKIVISDD